MFSPRAVLQQLHGSVRVGLSDWTVSEPGTRVATALFIGYPGHVGSDHLTEDTMNRPRCTRPATTQLARKTFTTGYPATEVAEIRTRVGAEPIDRVSLPETKS